MHTTMCPANSLTYRTRDSRWYTALMLKKKEKRPDCVFAWQSRRPHSKAKIENAAFLPNKEENKMSTPSPNISIPHQRPDKFPFATAGSLHLHVKLRIDALFLQFRKFLLAQPADIVL
jgi:hypothetical protein